MKIKPLLFTFIFFVICVFIVFLLTDFPKTFTSYKSKRISAIALRDNVSTFEKRGTALFTIPYLEKYYSFNYLEAKYDWVSTGQFRTHAEKLLEDCDSLDVYILSHGNMFYQWFTRMDSSLQKKIRLVYNTGCDNDSQYVSYKKRNINFYVGHTGENSASPVFYFYFLRRMFSGNSIEKTVTLSNEKSESILKLFMSDRDTINGSLGKFHDLKN